MASEAGSCAVTFTLTRAAGVLHLFVANAGDCRAVLYTGAWGASVPEVWEQAAISVGAVFKQVLSRGRPLYQGEGVTGSRDAWPCCAPVCVGRAQWLLYSSSVRAGWEQCGGSGHQEEEAARGGTPGSGCVRGQCCSSVGAGQEGSMSVLPPLVPAAMPKRWSG